MDNFKIDYSLCKTSADGSIMAKVNAFLEQFKTHETKGFNVYARSPMVSACDREVEVLDRHTGNVKKVLMFGSNSYLNATNLQTAINRAVEVTKNAV